MSREKASKSTGRIRIRGLGPKDQAQWMSAAESLLRTLQELRLPPGTIEISGQSGGIKLALHIRIHGHLLKVVGAPSLEALVPVSVQIMAVMIDCLETKVRQLVAQNSDAEGVGRLKVTATRLTDSLKTI